MKTPLDGMVSHQADKQTKVNDTDKSTSTTIDIALYVVVRLLFFLKLKKKKRKEGLFSFHRSPV